MLAIPTRQRFGAYPKISSEARGKGMQCFDIKLILGYALNARKDRNISCGLPGLRNAGSYPSRKSYETAFKLRYGL
jgi:hypothetical protein